MFAQAEVLKKLPFSTLTFFTPKIKQASTDFIKVLLRFFRLPLY